MNLFIINILLSLAWIGLNGEFTPENFVFGFVLGYLMLWFGERGKDNDGYLKKTWKVIGFFFFFLWEVIKTNIKVMSEILTPRQKMEPGIVAVPLDAKTDLEIVLLANLITFTPGTLSLDVSDDRKYLYVHAMFIDDPEVFKRELKQNLEKRILEVLR